MTSQQDTDQNTPTNTLKEILYNYLGQFKNDGYLSQGNTDTTTNAIESLITEAYKKGYIDAGIHITSHTYASLAYANLSETDEVEREVIV